MISVTSTNKKTAAVIGDVATVLNLELSSQDSEEAEEEVSIDDTVVYNIEDAMTIPLKKGEDGKDHYAIVSVSLAMNSKDKDYKKYGETLADQESLIKGEIVESFGSFTMEEIQQNPDSVRGDILSRIQSLFDSQFVYKVTFRDIKEQ
jgi:flagellar FliL protein